MMKYRSVCYLQRHAFILTTISSSRDVWSYVLSLTRTWDLRCSQSYHGVGGDTVMSTGRCVPVPIPGTVTRFWPTVLPVSNPIVVGIQVFPVPMPLELIQRMLLMCIICFWMRCTRSHLRLALPVADPTISTPSGPQRNVHARLILRARMKFS